jgi:glucose/arabinose dehydrogenase/mono/diheme cytochrome c family protein
MMKKITRFFLAVVLLTGISSRPADAALVNRWSFNNANGSGAAGTTFADSVSGAVATVKGNGATLGASAITLPGTTTGAQADANISAYLNLPNGLISNKTNMTIELWATPVSSKTWQRYFDFGRMINGDGSGAAGEWNGAGAPASSKAYDQFMLAQNSSDLGALRAATRHGYTGSGTAGPEFVIDATPATTAGTQYYFAVVFEDGLNVDGSSNAGGGRVTLYRDGVLLGAMNVALHLANLSDVNNWLGRSQWSGDTMANITYSEFRIHSHAFTAGEVATRFAAGPDATFAVPVAVADSATMQYNQKIRVPVLANDTGGVIPTQITVVQQPQFGTAAAQSDGTILYAHTTGAPASDTFTYRVNGYVGTSNTATVTVNFSNSLRISNTTLNVPSAPPQTAIQLGAAFSSLAAFSQPVCLASPPADTKRLFVCEKTGVLKLIPDVTAASPTQSVFLDLPALLTSRGETLSSSGEQGLLGVAFHPNYATNRYFYVFYSVKSPSTGSTIYERVSRFTTQAGNPNAADTTSELNLINQVDVATNHNGGDLHFGPDGYLYISVGDGGDQNDTENNAQHIDKNFFSGILRIDVDKKAGNPAPNLPHPAIPTDSGSARYAVPSDNPFIGFTSYNGTAIVAGTLRTEFYAVGLRNPWRFSFDSLTGELWTGNVGQDKYEGVELITKGCNCGWSFYEQNHNGPKIASVPGGFTYTHPVYEYAHSGVNTPANPNYEGACVIGGVVYRGTRFSSLVGNYIFADYVSGNIWSLVRNGAAAPTVTRIAGQSGIVALGTDPSNGDVLMANINTGTLQRLTTGAVAGSFPQTLSATGLFADLTDLSPNPGVLPYSPNLTFWSDFAAKRRWFVIPDAVSKMAWSRDGAWTFPSGTVWVKHFDMELTRTNPPTTGGTGPRKRIETRLLVKNSTGVYGVSYRWNDAGTEATLVADGGDDFDIGVTQNGQPYTQRWHIPSRADCITCHNAQAGGALSFNTRQLNLPNVINGFAGNQIDLLRTGGYFSNTPDSPNVLPRHVRPDETAYPLETRVRSYFAVNCAYCHQSGGSGPSWDGRPQLTLEQTGLINGAATSALHTGDKLIVPNDTTHSVVYNRIALTNGYTRMPPIASNELDQTDISLLAQWIQGYSTARQSYTDWRLAKFGSGTSAPGAPDADPDNDSRKNRFEYLTGTEPLVPDAQLFGAALSLSPGGLATFSYTLSPNASGQVEISSDLSNWAPWNVPGNDGIPRDGVRSIQGQVVGDRCFFRLRLDDR